jgi:hypothetical protein
VTFRRDRADVGLARGGRIERGQITRDGGGRLRRAKAPANHHSQPEHAAEEQERADQQDRHLSVVQRECPPLAQPLRVAHRAPMYQRKTGPRYSSSAGASMRSGAATPSTESALARVCFTAQTRQSRAVVLRASSEITRSVFLYFV